MTRYLIIAWLLLGLPISLILVSAVLPDSGYVGAAIGVAVYLISAGALVSESDV